MMKEIRAPVITAFVMLLLLLLVTLNVQGEEKRLLEVTFLDVGQGDATFIESPSGTQVLIDGGKGNRVLSSLHTAMGFFDTDIDMVVATHPDMDHIGGLIDVLKKYTVHTILMTENMSDTPAFLMFLKKVKEEGSQVIYARRGQVYDLGFGVQGSTTLTILFPDHDPSGLESNMSSIVARLVYGESEYMLTGDSPKEIEEYLVSIGTSTLVSDVLKVGHHGSRTSSAETFVTAVHPLYAIISAGKDNTYGHPHKEVTDLLTVHNIQQKNTADEGSIRSFSDGNILWFK